MKITSSFLCLASLSVFAWSGAAAEIITVKVTARVTSVTDSANLLGVPVAPGQLFTGTYSYDTSAPGQPRSPNVTRYLQQGIMASIKLSSGSLAFQTDSPATLSAQIDVGNSPPGGQDSLIVDYRGNRTLASGANVYIDFLINDFNGTLVDSSDLLTTAPNLQPHQQKVVWIYGGLGSDSFFVDLVWETAELVPAQSIEVSPGASSFLPQQRFDAALLLPPGSTVASAQANSNGTPLSLSYPGTCVLGIPTSAGRTVLQCPDAHAALVPGITQVDWTVTLTDGTVLSQTVEWKAIQ